MGDPLMLDPLMPVPMFPGRDGGPRGPGWFMNWLLYAWFGPIWKEELIWKTRSIQLTITEAKPKNKKLANDKRVQNI